MKRREFLLSLAGAVAASGSLRAQQKAMPVIGFLNPTSPEPLAPYVAAFRQRCQCRLRSGGGRARSPRRSAALDRRAGASTLGTQTSSADLEEPSVALIA